MDNLRHLEDRPCDSAAGYASLVSTLTAHAGFFVFSYSPAIKSLVSWSDNAEAILGARDVTLVRDGNLFLRHVHPDDRFLLLSELEKSLKGEVPYRTTYRWIRPDNDEVRWLHCRASLVRRDNEELFEGIIIDLSSEFTGSIGKLAGLDSVTSILAAFPVMVFTLDRDLRLVRINRPGESSVSNFGDPDFKAELFKIGRPILDCFADENQRNHFESILREVLSGAVPHHRTRVFQGSLVQSLEITPLADEKSIEGLLCIISDISETVRLERQLAEFQKVEGLKLLAAGVAHHFNNSLQTIIGHATVINSHPDNPDLVVTASQSIIDAVDKTSDLSRQLFVFEEGSRGALQQVDINLVVMAATSHIEDLLSSGFKVGVVFGNISHVMGRQTELVEALEAVLRNARESMASSADPGGNISVKTSESRLQDLEVADLAAGTYVKITVADSGRGMSDETRRRCFEPFYTTKETDARTGISLHASGLGLSKAFMIIREFGGAIAVDSKPGRGTVFSIYLPVSEPATGATTETAVRNAPLRSPEILVIDDDSMVLNTVSTMLSDLGYSCITADNYSTAISHARSYSSSLRLVLLDAVMPGMGGAGILKRLKKIRQDLKVIGFSGASQSQTQPLLDAGAEQILMKPVSPRVLTEVVGRLMNSGTTAAAG